MGASPFQYMNDPHLHPSHKERRAESRVGLKAKVLTLFSTGMRALMCAHTQIHTSWTNKVLLKKFFLCVHVCAHMCTYPRRNVSDPQELELQYLWATPDMPEEADRRTAGIPHCRQPHQHQKAFSSPKISTSQDPFLPTENGLVSRNWIF